MENIVKINPKPVQQSQQQNKKPQDKKAQDKKATKRIHEEPQQVYKKQFIKENKKCDPNMCRDLKNCLKDHFI